MKYLIRGTRRDTGEAIKAVVSAQSIDEAEQKATRHGIDVANVSSPAQLNQPTAATSPVPPADPPRVAPPNQPTGDGLAPASPSSPGQQTTQVWAKKMRRAQRLIILALAGMLAMIGLGVSNRLDLGDAWTRIASVLLICVMLLISASLAFTVLVASWRPKGVHLSTIDELLRLVSRKTLVPILLLAGFGLLMFWHDPGNYALDQGVAWVLMASSILMIGFVKFLVGVSGLPMVGAGRMQLKIALVAAIINAVGFVGGYAIYTFWRDSALDGIVFLSICVTVVVGPIAMALGLNAMSRKLARDPGEG